MLFVDDNILAAQALQRWFGCVPGLSFAGWASDTTAALARPSGQDPDVVLLDLEMPGTDTLALIPRLLSTYPRARVLMLSGHTRPAEIAATLDAGAAGYICKDEPTATIADLVKRAAAGECVLSPLAQRAFMGNH